MRIPIIYTAQCISPLKIANYFITLGEDIKDIYNNEIKN